jgi:predicted choloylglycine hydrolase
MSDCLWGLLDGINDAGLAVSLTFGGRRAVGDGFAIPLVVRYLLETCDTADQARHTLERIPVHAAQNVSVVDASGGTLTAHLAPDRGAEFTPTPVTTNHQGIVDWPEYTRAVHSVERERYLLGLLEDGAITPDRFVQAFLEPPLHNRNYSQGTGTLYTAVYHPTEGRVEYRWPGYTWAQSFDDFTCAAHTETFADEPLAA